MPIEEQISASIYEWAEVNADKMEILYQFKGGWEIWAQCEIALFLYNKFTFHYNIPAPREEKVYGNGQRCDLYIPFSENQKMIMELKCFSIQNEQNFFKNLRNDYLKLSRLPRRHTNDLKISIGLFPPVNETKWDPDEMAFVKGHYDILPLQNNMNLAWCVI
ncbi:hypothetical protein [Salibacterium aidingense]|uniref:hypothetical protein n=1 Tax=Salibacterium aidingense TaxID=384933 RepID=UPI00042817F6|nr:hypothetical protein [Salibacterium aidingense]